MEVGPGIGTLTTALARRAKQVIAVELDDQLIPILRETLGDYDKCRGRPRRYFKTFHQRLIAKTLWKWDNKGSCKPTILCDYTYRHDVSRGGPSPR